MERIFSIDLSPSKESSIRSEDGAAHAVIEPMKS